MRIDAHTGELLGDRFADIDLSSVRLVHKGPVAWVVRHVLRQGGMTVAPYIFYGKSRFEPSRHESIGLLAHELVHLRQYRDLGHVRFLARYLVDLARNRFRYARDLPLEREAYGIQDEVLRELRTNTGPLDI
jgi:hypothetical protein